VIPDSKGPFRLFVNKSILEDNNKYNKSNYFLGNKSKNKKDVQAQDERKKSRRISKKSQIGNN